jgi:hypothetical protein
MFHLHQVHSFLNTEILVVPVDLIQKVLVAVVLDLLAVQLLGKLGMDLVEQDNHFQHLLLH